MHAEPGQLEPTPTTHAAAPVASTSANPTATTFIATVGLPPPSPPPMPRKLVGSVSFWALLLVLTWLAASMLMVIWLLRRRQELDREITAARKERQAQRDKEPQIDAWAEAGRRAQPSNPATDPSGEPAPRAAATPDPSTPRPLAIITGGARRVGRASCLALARAGFDILVTYRHSASDAASLIEELSDLGANASAEQVDTSDEHAVEAFARALVEQNRVVDALVLNASSYEPTPLDQLDADTLLRDFRVNALAGVLLTARLAPCLRASKREGGGAVVVMCDVHAMGRPRLDFASYNITKAAACESVYTLARELAPHIRVCGVAPGAVAWPEHGHESEELAQKRYLRRVPLARVGTPDDAANAVRWLIVEATYVTGQIIRVDGGRWIT